MQEDADENRRWKVAYDWIKDAIDSGRFAMGTPLRENELAREIGISRTPVREALHRLEGVNYVTITPLKGAFVADVSLEDLREIYEIRKLLEPFAALSSALRIPDVEIDKMEKGWLELKKVAETNGIVDLTRVSAMDLQLHMNIINYSTNNRSASIIKRYDAQIRRFQKMSAQSRSNDKDTIGQHLEILATMRSRDAKKLSELLYSHIAKSESNIMKEYYLR